MLISDIMNVIVTSKKASEIILISEIHFQKSKMNIFTCTN